MKKSISVWSFAGGSLREKMELAKDAGFQAIEVAMDEEGEITPSSTEEQVREVRRTADEVGIEMPRASSGSTPSRAGTRR